MPVLHQRCDVSSPSGTHLNEDSELISCRRCRRQSRIIRFKAQRNAMFVVIMCRIGSLFALRWCELNTNQSHNWVVTLRERVGSGDGVMSLNKFIFCDAIKRFQSYSSIEATYTALKDIKYCEKHRNSRNAHSNWSRMSCCCCHAIMIVRSWSVHYKNISDLYRSRCRFMIIIIAHG